MRFTSRIACALLVLGLASPATASLIPDPTIGVRGGGFGTLPISDGSWAVLQPCAENDGDLTSAGYVCQYYEFGGGTAIDTLAFQTADALGNLFPDGSYTQAPESDPDYLLNQDANTAYFQYFVEGPALIECLEGPCEFTFFFKLAPGETAPGPFQVSLRGFRLCDPFDCLNPGDFVTNENLTDPSPIPEPALGLLLALGTSLVAGRRLRRR